MLCWDITHSYWWMLFTTHVMLLAVEYSHSIFTVFSQCGISAVWTICSSGRNKRHKPKSTFKQINLSHKSNQMSSMNPNESELNQSESTSWTELKICWIIKVFFSHLPCIWMHVSLVFGRLSAPQANISSAFQTVQEVERLLTIDFTAVNLKIFFGKV